MVVLRLLGRNASALAMLMGILPPAALWAQQRVLCFARSGSLTAGEPDLAREG